MTFERRHKSVQSWKCQNGKSVNKNCVVLGLFCFLTLRMWSFVFLVKGKKGHNFFARKFFRKRKPFSQVVSKIAVCVLAI